MGAATLTDIEIRVLMEIDAAGRNTTWEREAHQEAWIPTLRALVAAGLVRIVAPRTFILTDAGGAEAARIGAAWDEEESALDARLWASLSNERADRDEREYRPCPGDPR